MSTTALYSPYKAVGYVTDGNPFCINRLGEDTFLTTSVGKAFQVYRFDRLTVCLVSRPAPGIITAIQCFGHETFCAVENDIVVYDRTQIVRTYKVHQVSIVGLLMIGRTLISYDQENHIKVIDTKTRRVVAEMTSLQPSKIVRIMHPATYVNKVVVGYANGHMELWNIQKRAIIYTFAAHLTYLEDGRSSRRSRSSSKDIFMDPYGDDDDDDDADVPSHSSSSSRSGRTKKGTAEAVTCIEQSPACDVLGVGFSSGDILLLNAKLDVVLFSFRQDGGSVTSISFRTDTASERHPFMVTASIDGRLHVWNLGQSNSATDGGAGGGVRLERKLENSLHEAHSAAIGRVHFLYGEPVMVSAAVDNTIKVWIFDSPDGTARILRSREGHSGWPLRIRYYGGSTNASMRDNSDATSCEILSAGSDGTLRLFNTAIEVQNRELSQNTILKKLGMQRRNERLPVTIGFDFSETRQRDWGDLVTIHKNHANVYVWKFKNRTVTDMILRQPSWPKNEKAFTVDRSTHATAVVMSPCGNYCAVGTRGGVIYLYNVQSGLPRGAFPASKALGAIKEGLLKQRQAVPGNVYHQHKSFVDEGKGGETNSLKINQNKQPSQKTNKNGESEGGGGNISEPFATGVQSQIGHTQAVTGMFIEIANTVMVTCALDGWVIFWDFGTKDVLHRVSLKSPAMMLQGFQDGGFVAIASQDRTVRVFDVFTYKLSRRFSGHSREISDLAFAPDGRRLLTASLDSTVRVWDMPTGRCLSWLSFEAPVLSMTMSHSGEFLCLTQADKEGIFMYVDRSLYETVHFWKEPVAPISVADSLVLIESKNPGGEEGEGMSGSGAADGDGDEEEEKDTEGEEVGGRGDGGGELVLPSQAQVAMGGIRESITQRGPRTLTMAAVPRAYWTSLFNLESIKARNRATAAPEAPQRAPFFLPTVVRGGATPSFPTPVEFAQLMKQQQQEQQAAEGVAAVAGKQSSSSTAKSPASSSSSQSQAGGKTKGKGKGVDGKGNDADSEAAVLAELAAMGSAWDDNDEEGGGADWGDDEEEEEEDRTSTTAVGKRAKLHNDKSGDGGSGGGSELLSRARTGSEVGLDHGGYVLDRRPMSRIIHRKTALPRCKLVAFLLREYPDYNHLHHHHYLHNGGSNHRDGFFTEEGMAFVDGSASTFGEDNMDDVEDGPILEYLKQLPPPAVDVELRALCAHKDDEEGLSLLRCLLAWFARKLRSGLNFEVLQAYLHRTVTIYADLILQQSEPSLLADELEAVRKAHNECSGRFRQLVQSNLCLLKMLAGLPPT